MKSRLRGRRGFTLTELVITMALSMVILTMVITFSMMTNNWTLWGVEMYDVQLTQESTKKALFDFLSYYDVGDYYFYSEPTVQQYLAVLRVEDDSEVSRLSYDDGCFTFVDMQGKQHSYATKRVAAVMFAVRNGDSGLQLMRVRVEYKRASLGKTEFEEQGVFVVGASSRAQTKLK